KHMVKLFSVCHITGPTSLMHLFKDVLGKITKAEWELYVKSYFLQNNGLQDFVLSANNSTQGKNMLHESSLNVSNSTDHIQILFDSIGKSGDQSWTPIGAQKTKECSEKILNSLCYIQDLIRIRNRKDEVENIPSPAKSLIFSTINSDPIIENSDLIAEKKEVEKIEKGLQSLVL